MKSQTTDSNTALALSHQKIILPWDVPTSEITHGPHIPRLYRCPPKFKGESQESWILRIAERYGCSPAQIAEYLNYYNNRKGLDYLLSKKRIRRIAMVTMTDPLLIVSRLELGLLRLNLTNRKLLVSPGNGVVRQRACIYCLVEDEIPHFRLSWQLATTILCDRHDAPLTEFCPTCSSPIDWAIGRRSAMPPQSRGDFLRYCPSCLRRLDHGRLPRRVPDRLGQMLKRFQRLVLQVISHGLHHHPIYGSLSRNEFIEIFLTQGEPLFLYSDDDISFRVDWRRVVHPEDYSAFWRLFKRQLIL